MSNNIPTPHIKAGEGDIAKSVLMPGDPLRAKFIAENYLENVSCFNKVRGMLGFTGTYKGKRVSVMGSGMGMPSIGIYSYELYNFYGVENIIRVGSAGALQDNVNVRDIVIAMGACTDSNYGFQYELGGLFAPIASYKLLSSAVDLAGDMPVNTHVGNICSSDGFYTDEKFARKWQNMGVLAVEMEAAALYMNAARSRKNALCILTVSDHVFKRESLSSDEREKGFGSMVTLGLETVLKSED
ncbi:MAG: purine-nucleoside phosphorylase [Clostridia bacterium]|nr:purine-nucleoside phosphorylase [Clostridia bacterium]MBR2735321.1 purine-nucleoside phosphorylase [Clostridia bacterium]